MARALPPGKLPAALLAEILETLAPGPPELRLGPRPGEDACAIDVPSGTLVVAADPITLTGHGIGTHAVLINANDVAVTGTRPRWFLATLLLPEGSTPETARQIFAEMQAALAACGAVLVGGHTEVSTAVRQPVIAGQMLGLAEPGRIVRTGGVRPGDIIVQAGPAPVEGAAVLAAEAGDRLGAVDPRERRRAEAALREPGISVVAPALLATEYGATALHDPTEGGMAAGLAELSAASNVKLHIDAEAVLWYAPGLAICDALGADPWSTLASGALLAAFPEDGASMVCEKLVDAGTPARPIGRAEAGTGVVLLDGSEITAPERDEVARLLA